MKIGDRVKIRNIKDIVFDIHHSPGWDSYGMNKYCGKKFKISKIYKRKNEPWVRLKGTSGYVWHIEWLIDVPIQYLEDDLFEI